jgi:nitric oxide reductase activation protein
MFEIVIAVLFSVERIENLTQRYHKEGFNMAPSLNTLPRALFPLKRDLQHVHNCR